MVENKTTPQSPSDPSREAVGEEVRSPRQTVIQLLWEKQFENSPWGTKFHLIRPDSLEADYGALADKIITALCADNTKASPPPLTAPNPPAGGEAVAWGRVNDEPFEYAIQQGPHGDEFVKLLDGPSLRRPLPAPHVEALVRALSKAGYCASTTGDGEHQIKIGFPSLKEMQDAHQALGAALAALNKGAGK